MSTNPLDAAPDDGLAPAFELPAAIQEDARLVALHNEIVERLRREASGLPMGTIQNLLLERISSLYVIIKHKEANGSFSLNQQKEFNTYWLALTVEFNKTLMAHQDKLRESLMLEMTKITLEAINEKTIPDAESRRSLRRELQERFSKIGL